MVLPYVPVIEIGNSKIKKDIEKKGKVENDEIKTVIIDPCNVLNITVNSENPDGFN
jgi:hypothetical protein